jgi:serine/threonine protein kinase
MAADFKRARDIFLAALDQPDLGEREALLRQACGADEELRVRIEQMLRRHEQAGGFLGPADADPLATAGQEPPEVTAEPAAEAVGARVGPYKLLQKLGEGGMGAVWLAEQHEPVRRRVALKLIKAGMDSNRVRARFEQERQALALMDHPHIAKVLDGGTTAHGRPYFVMELVKGIPITKYCDQEHLTPRQRLELLIPVCQAVQHAHQKGVIHRDLKPSNVLIALYDGKPVPKVIDFGVAKATAQHLSERTVFTEVGSLVGTLEYMAPEQAELNNLDVDTRADIYSLGVLLYELLTGSPPFTAKQLRGAAFTEMLRIIREQEPQRPSTRLSSSEQLPAIAAKRKLEPARLTRLVRGELDWIAMKCLEKERSRQYETANGLAADLLRYLADEPVAAGPPSATYRLRKLVRRNRGTVLAVALVLLALVAGTAVSTWQAVRATEAETQALEERDAKDEALRQALANEQRARAAAEAEGKAKAKAEKAAEAEKQANGLAQKRLGQLEKANALLASVFRDLDPHAKEKGGPALKEQLVARLDEAARELEGEDVGDAVAVAQLQQTLGNTYRGLGEPGKAVALLVKARQAVQTALGPDHPDTLTSLNSLAGAYRDVGQAAKAVPLLEQALEMQKVKLGADHPDTLSTLNNLALAYLDTGEAAKAVPLLAQALQGRKAKLGPDHPDTLTSLNNLAGAYRDNGQVKKALPLFEQALEGRNAKLGPDHPHTLTSLNSLAVAYLDLGRATKAVPLLERALEAFKAKLGPDHPDTLTSLNNLAAAYRANGQVKKALPLFEQALQGYKAKLGPDHPNTLASLNNLAGADRDVGQAAKAVPLLEQALEMQKVKLGADHPDTLSTLNNLALAYQAAGRAATAMPLLEQALEGCKAKLGPDHPKTLTSLNNLAMAYVDTGEAAKAVPLLEQALQGRKAKLGPDHPDTLTSLNKLATAYQEAGQPERAEPLLRQLLERLQKKDGPQAQSAAALLAGLGLNLLQQKKYDQAEQVLRECLAIREKQLPDSWLTFNTRSMVGGALLGQKEYADAEPLLIEGYEGLLKLQAQIPPQGRPRLDEARARLVELYEATGEKEKAEKYRNKAKSAPPSPDGNR